VAVTFGSGRKGWEGSLTHASGFHFGFRPSVTQEHLPTKIVAGGSMNQALRRGVVMIRRTRRGDIITNRHMYSTKPWFHFQWASRPALVCLFRRHGDGYTGRRHG
jgi:hypothetical protein